MTSWARCSTGGKIRMADAAASPTRGQNADCCHRELYISATARLGASAYHTNPATFVSDCWVGTLSLYAGDTVATAVSFPAFLEMVAGSPTLQAINSGAGSKTTFTAEHFRTRTVLGVTYFDFSVTSFGHADYNAGAVATYDRRADNTIRRLTGPSQLIASGSPAVVNLALAQQAVARATGVFATRKIHVTNSAYSDPLNDLLPIATTTVDGWEIGGTWVSLPTTSGNTSNVVGASGSFAVSDLAQMCIQFGAGAVLGVPRSAQLAGLRSRTSWPRSAFTVVEDPGLALAWDSLDLVAV